MYKLIFILAVAGAWSGAHADDVLGRRAAAGSAVECPLAGQEKPIATEYGSVGFMKNLAESEDSIRAIAARQLQAALSSRSVLAEAGCEQNCDGAEQTEVIYRVSPVAFLAEEQQNAVCLDFERETAAAPMRFGPREFATVEKLNDWIMEFSQGRGDDGKRLYEQCSSNCSPRYTFVIAEQGPAYEVTSEVQCGLARDKANDQYLVSTALRWSCAVN